MVWFIRWFQRFAAHSRLDNLRFWTAREGFWIGFFFGIIIGQFIRQRGDVDLGEMVEVNDWFNLYEWPKKSLHGTFIDNRINVCNNTLFSLHNVPLRQNLAILPTHKQCSRDLVEWMWEWFKDVTAPLWQQNVSLGSYKNRRSNVNYPLVLW